QHSDPRQGCHGAGNGFVCSFFLADGPNAGMESRVWRWGGQRNSSRCLPLSFELYTRNWLCLVFLARCASKAGRDSAKMGFVLGSIGYKTFREMARWVAL